MKEGRKEGRKEIGLLKLGEGRKEGGGLLKSGVKIRSFMIKCMLVLFVRDH